MKRLFLSISVTLISFSTQAKQLKLECFPSEKQACKNAYAMDNQCIASIEIYGAGFEMINYRSFQIGFDIKYVPTRHEISISENNGVVKFNDETGDQNGELHRLKNSNYSGYITIDQDFSYDVMCFDKTIGYF